jgi:hypothetical protein
MYQKKSTKKKEDDNVRVLWKDETLPVCVPLLFHIIFFLDSFFFLMRPC